MQRTLLQSASAMSIEDAPPSGQNSPRRQVQSTVYRGGHYHPTQNPAPNHHPAPNQHPAPYQYVQPQQPLHRNGREDSRNNGHLYSNNTSQLVSDDHHRRRHSQETLDTFTPNSTSMQLDSYSQSSTPSLIPSTSSTTSATTTEDSPGRRGANYSDASLKQLCVSWLHISQCPITGTDQRHNQFWQKITDHFNANVPRTDQRTFKSLSSRWSTLNANMSRFAGCHQQVKMLNESGKTAEDQWADTLEMYKSDCNSPFKEMCCYNIVKHAPKWQENPFYVEHCGRTNAIRSDHHSDIDLGSDIESLPRMQRPTGSKMAKRGRSSLAEEYIPQMVENSTVVATSARDIAKQGREAQATLQNMLEFTILTSDLSKLEDAARAEIEARRAQIIARSRSIREAE